MIMKIELQPSTKASKSNQKLNSKHLKKSLIFHTKIVYRKYYINSKCISFKSNSKIYKS